MIWRREKRQQSEDRSPEHPLQPAAIVLPLHCAVVTRHHGNDGQSAEWPHQSRRPLQPPVDRQQGVANGHHTVRGDDVGHGIGERPEDKQHAAEGVERRADAPPQARRRHSRRKAEVEVVADRHMHRAHRKRQDERDPHEGGSPGHRGPARHPQTEDAHDHSRRVGAARDRLLGPVERDHRGDEKPGERGNQVGGAESPLIVVRAGRRRERHGPLDLCAPNRQRVRCIGIGSKIAPEVHVRDSRHAGITVPRDNHVTGLEESAGRTGRIDPPDDQHAAGTRRDPAEIANEIAVADHRGGAEHEENRRNAARDERDGAEDRTGRRAFGCAHEGPQCARAHAQSQRRSGALAAMMAKKLLASRLAPPTSAPSTSGSRDQLGDVVWLHAAAVQHAATLGRVESEPLLQSLANVEVRLAGLRGRGVAAGADRPHRLVGQHHLRQLLAGDADRALP